MREAEKPAVEELKRVIIVSDGTGETAAMTIKAAMAQFESQRVYYTRYKNVRTEAQIDAICDDAAVKRDLIIFTIVSPELRHYLAERASKLSVPSLDLLGPLLAGLSAYFKDEPRLLAGLLRNVNAQYFEKIDAMEFTIRHDDGKDLTGLDQADLIILGISRTSKTPLSMYLSHQGFRVANIPLIPGFELPQEIYQIDQRKVVGLTIDPEDLTTIRRSRLQRLGSDKGGDYADPLKVADEVEYANDLFRKNRRWAVFNVTGKALEETASEIIKLVAGRRPGPRGTPSTQGGLSSPGGDEK
ncbi:MAG TPA: pyruvate, water dikinase regulatory protein [Bdellovibrionota bacterium]|nr:pyruvate, water dikinase regulatory protein [Bdellovibrionota bacterium]